MPRTEGRINWTQVIATAAVSTGVGIAVERAIADDTTDGGTTDDTTTTTTTTEQTQMDDQLERLVDTQTRRNPGPEAVDAFSGQTVELTDGQKVTVTVTPANGYDLRVKKSYFDRRTDHTYVHNIGGIEVSSSHEAILKATRRVMQGGQVVAEATNSSGGPSEFDYEIEAWAIPTGVDA